MSQAVNRPMNSIALLGSYWTKLFHPAFDLDPEAVYAEYLKMQDLEHPEYMIFIYPEI
ncbi:MAG: hypothetical protein ACXQS6_00300 [Candidatus Syntropharchaeales archaeon]|nr:hypothetical protein [Candidatus Syntrophoarchaeum sp.]